MSTQIIIFSKDRPLQLKALLESIFFYSIDDLIINIIYKESSEITYTTLVNCYNNISWIPETNFQIDTYNLLCKNFDFSLFLVDDVVFTRKFSLLKIEEYFSTSPNIHGCQLRLGRNIEGGYKFTDDLPFLTWNVLNSKSHWGYPFDLSSGMYRTSHIKNIFLDLISHNFVIKNPNFFEHYFYEYYLRNPTLLAEKRYFSPYFSVCLILTINRVQNEFINRFDTSNDFSPQTLNELYSKNISINWKKYCSILNTYPHWDGSELEFISNSKYSTLSSKLIANLEDSYLSPLQYYNKHKIKFFIIIFYNKWMRRIKYAVEIYTPFLNLLYRKIKKLTKNIS